MSYKDWTRAALIAVLILFVVVASSGMSFAAGWYLSPRATPSPTPAAAQADVEQRFGIFWEVWAILEREFNRDAPLNAQKMIYGAIEGAVRSLGDPYTRFEEPAEARYFDQDLEGSFEGIGATVDIVDGYLVIVEPLKDSPALKAGLQPGDIILEVDGNSIEGMDLIDAINVIRGPDGSEVRLLIRRQGVAEPFVVTVTRGRIQLPTVTYRELSSGVAYVQLAEFNSQATVQLQAALREALAKKPCALIFDLRGNPGGYLHIAVQVASQFIREGVIVTEKDSKGKSTEYRAEGHGLAYDVPLAVLVDGGSASASEIVAGAIQELGRGTVIGRRTFGKGSVQVSHSFPDGSALRVTVARWYTPKGRQIDHQGLTPDVDVPWDANTPAGADPVLNRAVEFLTALQPLPPSKP